MEKGLNKFSRNLVVWEEQNQEEDQDFIETLDYMGLEEE